MPRPRKKSAEQPAKPQAIASEIVQSIAAATAIPDTSTEFNVQQFEQEAAPREERPSFTRREQTRLNDPSKRHMVQFGDGFTITVQESSSRKTVEVEFGNGTKGDRPKNFAAIKEKLVEEGFTWNGSNAWVVDLAPERGSMAQKIEARAQNKAIRAHVEDVVFPALVGIEELARGEIPFTEQYRNVVARASQGR